MKKTNSKRNTSTMRNLIILIVLLIIMAGCNYKTSSIQLAVDSTAVTTGSNIHFFEDKGTVITSDTVHGQKAKKINTSVPVVVDTLEVKVNSTVIYQIDILGTQGSGRSLVIVTNFEGVYFSRKYDIIPYAGNGMGLSAYPDIENKRGVVVYFTPSGPYKGIYKRKKTS